MKTDAHSRALFNIYFGFPVKEPSLHASSCRTLGESCPVPRGYFGRMSRRGNCVGRTVKYRNQITCFYVQYWVKQSYRWQQRNISVRSWTMEFKEELDNIGLAFVWTKKQECDLREITKIMEGRCNNIERLIFQQNCQRKAH
jgi:hypothetical protein